MEGREGRRRSPDERKRDDKEKTRKDERDEERAEEKRDVVHSEDTPMEDAAPATEEPQNGEAASGD